MINVEVKLFIYMLIASILSECVSLGKHSAG